MAIIKEMGYRSSQEEILRQNKKITGNQLLTQTLDGMNIFVIILNSKREIVFMNRELCQALQVKYEDTIGVRPGELLRCKYSNKSEFGCGYANECALCEVKNIVVDVIHNNQHVKKNVSIVSEIQGIEVTSSFEESASKIDIDDEAYYLVAFVDRSSVIDQSNLERIFYHDILNSATSVYNVIRLLKMENDKFKDDEDIEYIQGYIQNIIEEIEFQRSISYAEKNDLDIEYKKIDINKMISQTITSFKADQRFNHIGIRFASDIKPLLIESEPVLIRRIFTNLLKMPWRRIRITQLFQYTLKRWTKGLL